MTHNKLLFKSAKSQKVKAENNNQNAKHILKNWKSLSKYTQTLKKATFFLLETIFLMVKKEKKKQNHKKSLCCKTHKPDLQNNQNQKL